MAEHGGTHIDAPIHFSKGGQALDQVPIERLIGAGIRINVAAQCTRDRDYLVTIQDFEQWEAEHGRIPIGAIVLVETGFARYWPSRQQYLGTELRGSEGVRALHFPGLHPSAANWLVEQRQIKAVGIDTASIDYGQSTTFDTHVALLSRNRAGARKSWRSTRASGSGIQRDCPADENCRRDGRAAARHCGAAFLALAGC